MIEFGGAIYFFDIDALENAIKIKEPVSSDRIVETTTTKHLDSEGKILNIEVTETNVERGREVDATKYDLLRMCFEVLIDYNEESDDTLGADRALERTPLAYKLAFNTLLNYGILKEMDEK